MKQFFYISSISFLLLLSFSLPKYVYSCTPPLLGAGVSEPRVALSPIILASDSEYSNLDKYTHLFTTKVTSCGSTGVYIRTSFALFGVVAVAVYLLWLVFRRLNRGK